MSNLDRPVPRVDEVIIEELKRAFDTHSILRRDDLNAEQKIAFIMAVDEVINCLSTWRDEYKL